MASPLVRRRSFQKPPAAASPQPLGLRAAEFGWGTGCCWRAGIKHPLGHEAQHRPCLPSQEIGNKKQKKAALSEEDDSGVEVYYREGEEEVEEMSVLPKVRGGGAGEEAAPGGRSLVSCLRTGLSSAPLSCPHFL